jgi:hypothetical protein
LCAQLQLAERNAFVAHHLEFHPLPSICGESNFNGHSRE